MSEDTDFLDRVVRIVEQALIGHVDPYSDGMSEYGIAHKIVPLVLSAIREPSDAMRRAGGSVSIPLPDERDQSEQSPDDDVAGLVWKAMIDAALGGKDIAA